MGIRIQLFTTHAPGIISALVIFLLLSALQRLIRASDKRDDV